MGEVLVDDDFAEFFVVAGLLLHALVSSQDQQLVSAIFHIARIHIYLLKENAGCELNRKLLPL